ncbi:MAG TPA: DEAD/DEAH box helicase family protein [Flavobacteriaceae bacterium]|nr:DEAD/DEAH box helicase family protein [Flavobacteriaceae bacterium]
MNYFVDVIIPIPLEKLFTYSITPAEASVLKSGIRVAVPFGISKIYTGIIHHIHSNKPLAYEAKEIYQILDQNPIVNPIQLKHWDWISKYYMCTLGDVMRAALPSPFILESETIITKSKNQDINDEDLKDDEFLIYEALHNQSSLKIHDVVSILEKKTVFPVIQSLIDKNIIKVEEEIFEKYKPKLVRYIKLHSNFSSDTNLESLLDSLKNAPKQHQVILTLFSISAQTKKPIKVSELMKQSDASSSIIKALIDKGILEEFYIQTDRIQFSGSDIENSKALNKFQTKALDEIKQSFKKQDVILLHGITSSGKTEIYVKLIEDILKQGKQVLYLLPEIALTTQLVNRLQNYFGKKVAVFHSKYSSHERVEVWNNVL